MNELTPIERNVMERLLDGEDEVLSALRKQLEATEVVKREMTGVGFYTTFSVPDSIIRLPDNRSFQFGDVVAEVPGLAHGAGFALFVKDGALNFLEGYTYDEPWPKVLSVFKLRYESVPRDLKRLIGS